MSEDVTPYGATTDDNQQRIDEARALIAKFGWSQREAARQLGADEGRFRQWLSGTVPIPGMVTYALRYLARDMAQVDARNVAEPGTNDE